MYLDNFFADRPELTGCIRCNDQQPLGLTLRMAFQPVVDARTRTVYGYEALVRGPGGEPAGWVLDRIDPGQLYTFDQTCRVLAIATAARLGLQGRLAINFIPNAVYEPAACIRLTLAAADESGFPAERLMFELTETERVAEPAHTLKILRDYQARGFVTAIDDFGAGYSGLSLLADFQPDIVKLDMALIRGIDASPQRQAIVAGVLSMTAALGCTVLAEGVETAAEYRQLRALGVQLFQGYLFARPGLETLPEPDWAALD
jgi:EAL domain-containing protein (putative c-di-GMP-specific phosphodiesterase class I)